MGPDPIFNLNREGNLEMFSLLKNRVTMLGVIAAALAFAMVGSAFAADGAGSGASASKHERQHKKKSKGLTSAQVHKIAKEEAKKYANSNPGAKGDKGDTGSTGPQGPPGKDVSGGTVTSVGSGFGLEGTVVLAGVLKVNPAQIQKRVIGACPSGQAVKGITEAGTVTCESVGGNGVQEVKSGPGLEGGPITNTGELKVNFAETQKRVTGECPSGSAVAKVAENGTVVCESIAAKLPGTLGVGESETGSWFATTNASEDAKVSISFPVPLAAAKNQLGTRFVPIGVGSSATAKLTEGSKIIKEVSKPLGGAAASGGLGAVFVEGEGIPANTLVKKVISPTELELSNAVTAGIGTEAPKTLTTVAPPQCDDGVAPTATAEHPEADSGFACVFIAHDESQKAAENNGPVRKSGSETASTGTSTAGALLNVETGGVEKQIWGTFAVTG